MLSEISQTEKNKYHMISLIHRIYKTKPMNKRNRNRLTDMENKQVVVKEQRGDCGRMDRQNQ